ncbi:MAG: mycofactocin biosynthesis chaperone MftB [Acidimicrobiales bacterium]
MRGLLSSSVAPTPGLDRALELHPQVALRPEPFGALAYHYGNRRLIFLRHPDMVAVVKALAAHPDLGATLAACGVDPQRWPSFVKALAKLEGSEIIRARQED